MAEHQSGTITSCYTYKRRPVVLVYYQHYTDVKQAIAAEKQIKGWSRKKKKALINENWELLKKLSRNYTQYGKHDVEDPSP